MAMVLQPSRVRLTQAIYFGRPAGFGVTSIAGGNGITATPNPIITTGTLDLGALTSDWQAGNFNINARNTTGWFNVVAYGADPTGIADSTASVAAAIAAAGPTAVIYFPRGTYLLTSEVTISSAGITILGDGRDASVIDFEPVAPAVCFMFNAGAGTSNNGTVRGLKFISSDVANTKIAVEVSDGVNFTIDNVNITGTWTGGSSIGFKVSGRQEIRIHDCAVNAADLPIVIGVNPHAAFLSFDHSSIERCELVVTAGLSNPVITISDGLGITNAGFRALALVRGSSGISMNNTTMATASQVIVIDDCRFEQTVGAAGYSIDMRSSSGQIQALTVRDCLLDANRNGIRLTNAKFFIAQNVNYPGTGTALNLSATVQSPTFIDFFAQTGSTITDASSGPVTISYTLGGNPAATGFGTLSPNVGAGADVSVNTKMIVGGAASPSGSQIDLFRDGLYNSDATAGLYIRSGVGATNTGLLVGTDKTNNTAFIQSREPATSYTTKPLALNPNGGNVGIATIAATRTLDLNGTQRWRGIAAPAVSEANSGTIYFDSATNKLKASLNGSAYVDVIGSGGVTGSGAAGQVAYWDGVTSLASPSGIYVDAVNNRLGINVPALGYSLDIDGDINLVNSADVIRSGNNTVFAVDLGQNTVGVGGFNSMLGVASTSFGRSALLNEDGSGVGENTMVGASAGINVTTGGQNTGVGSAALLGTNTGSSNTAIGRFAGQINTTGSDNVWVGDGADATAGNLTNAVAIGANAVVGASDSMVLGDAAMKVGIRTGTPAQPLDVDGAVAFRHKDIAVANGLNSDIALTDASLIRLTGATGAFSIGGFTGGTDGRVLRIINTAAQAMTIVNLDGASAATNQITTLTGADVVLAARTSACTLVFEDASDTWVLFSYN